MSTRIALIDDDKTVLMILADVLRDAGYSVDGYQSGEAALAALWDAPVNLIIADLVLPKMSGLDLVRELHKRPWATKVPVLAISSLQWAEEEIKSLPAQDRPSRVLKKPFQANELVGAVGAMLTRPRALTPVPSVLLGAEKAEHVTQLTSEFQTRMARVTFGESRRALRAPVRVEVRLQTGRDLVVEYTQNLSHDGLFVRTYNPLARDEEVEVTLLLPFCPKDFKLRGRVVRSVPLESAEVHISGPGMAIALIDVPLELKAQLQAFVAGVRAGTASLPSSPQHTVLLVGLEEKLPKKAASFLRRASLHTLWARDLAGAAAMLEHTDVEIAVLDGSHLPEPPLETLEKFRRPELRALLVVAERSRAAALGASCDVLDSSLPPGKLLDLLCNRLNMLRRASARVNCITLAKVSRVDGQLVGVLQNVSLGGLLIEVESPCAIGELLEVDFELPESGGRVRAAATVVRVARSAASAGFCVASSFERLEGDSRVDLMRFIESKVGLDAHLRYIGEHYSR
ncbi:MAG: PilZ domain-containing protein [Myxococcales bacterium]|nr:PilZ domain-containing protein [Myxococcales bacterium]